MCVTYFIVYPCNHALFASSVPCAPGGDSQIYDTHEIKCNAIAYDASRPGLPRICPGSRNGQACQPAPLHPINYAMYCVERHIVLADAVSVMPIWVYDYDGSKVGTRTKPWCMLDYITAWYCVKHGLAGGHCAIEPFVGSY